MEDRMNKLPQFIKHTIREEVRKRDRCSRFQAQIQGIGDHFFERLSAFESRFVETTRRTQKALKKVNADIQLCKAATGDDGQVDDISLEINELKRRQQILLELLNAIRSQNEQDFDGVTSQLTGVWTQLSAKRPNPA
jgi:hypothetical protein